MKASWFVPMVVLLSLSGSTAAKETVLSPRLLHLRVGPEREWLDFPKQPDDERWLLRFQASRNPTEMTLRLRQQDVKQTWKVLLNDKELGRLAADENDQVIYLAIPPGRLVEGENRLLIEQAGKQVDDIRVGEIRLDDRPLDEVLSEGSVELTVLDATASEKPTPCRVTVLNADGALMTVGAKSNESMAVRPGVIYSGTGQVKFGLPAGTYTVHAGRGFEYGIDTVRVEVQPGAVVRHTLRIRREVPTPGYVSCDPHVHTLTYSGHGDATIAERVLTIAGEGIELPVAAEHNRQIDYHDAAVKYGMRHYFTPVVGNEVTTAFGHFNIFPVRADEKIPDYKLKDWQAIFDSIEQQTGAKVVILNHGRDLHSGFRPLGPARHLALTGESLDGQQLRANAMEVVNSGAQQSDVLRLFQDWFGLLNRGIYLTPVGASDSHDVARHFVGQARTYIRCPDDDPGKIDVEEAVKNFLQGRVLVSCGLLTEITVNDRHGPGELAPASETVRVAVRVRGPSWVRADRVVLYANGYPVREATIPAERPELGVLWAGEWVLPRPRHDVHLVAIATGPGVKELYWPIASPYQPTSPRREPRVIGATGAVWLDGDGDGRKSCAHDYAQRLVKAAAGDSTKLMQSLGEYDEAVVVQAASLLQAAGVSVQDPQLREAARQAGPHVERGLQAFAEAWRDSEIARTEAK